MVAVGMLQLHDCLVSAVYDNLKPHFVLIGPAGDDRIYVNRDEVCVSAVHYGSQLGSLLIGYNFGAWQLWDLINMRLVYTSPVYDENIPVSHFAVQVCSEMQNLFTVLHTTFLGALR